MGHTFERRGVSPNRPPWVSLPSNPARRGRCYGEPISPVTLYVHDPGHSSSFSLPQCASQTYIALGRVECKPLHPAPYLDHTYIPSHHRSLAAFTFLPVNPGR